jgi:Tol biopolymer transport system component
VNRGPLSIALAVIATVLLSACGHTRNDAGEIVFSGTLAGQRGNANYYAEAPDGTHRRKLAFAATDLELSLSADGRFAAWRDIHPLDTEPIVVARSDGKGGLVVPLPRAAGAVSPSLSPDGKRLAIVYTPDAGGPQHSWKLWLVAPNGRGLRRLSAIGNVITAAWSPDGARIAFVVQASGADRTLNTGEIYVVGSDGRAPHRVARGREPSWSPDGRRLAFTDPRYRVDVVDGSGGAIHVVSRNAVGPAWSPDGKRLAFTRTVPCGGEGCPHTIVVVDVDAHAERTIGPTFGGSSELIWTTALS